MSAGGAAARIVVAGTTGSGKTTVARRIASATGAPYIELDALYWEPGWKPAPEHIFRNRVAEAVAAPAWVADGNYGIVRDLTWGSAEAMVWLDYPFPLVLRQLLGRTFRRWRRREVLWNGNRERLWEHFLTKDSLLLWAVRTHWKHRKTYPAQLAEQRFAHLRVERVRRPEELAASLAALGVAEGRAR